MVAFPWSSMLNPWKVACPSWELPGEKTWNALYTYFAMAFCQKLWSLRLEHILVFMFKSKAPQNSSGWFPQFLGPTPGSFSLKRHLFLEHMLRKSWTSKNSLIFWSKSLQGVELSTGARKMSKKIYICRKQKILRCKIKTCFLVNFCGAQHLICRKCMALAGFCTKKL